MPAYSFGREFIDPMLLCDKQQTSRPQTTRFHVGDTGYIYIEQRRPIVTKPLRRMTRAGIEMVCDRGYPFIPEYHQAIYHAHFLGTVKITEIYDIHPCEMSGEELEAWAWADWFEDVTAADTWFTAQYGGDWMQRWWTVTRWHGWLERYFEPGETIK